MKLFPFLAKKRTANPESRSRRRRPGNGHARELAEPDAAAGAQDWLTVVNVQKSYRSRMVVKGVSLATRRGEAVGLLGPNGAGKTTVFYMVTGLVPADNGQVTLDGRDVTRLPMYRRARLGIGYLPQEASIFRGLTVEQNIMAVLELVEPNRRRRKEQLDNLLEEFNIEVGAGLGPLKGKIWRVGLMGENSRPEVVQKFLAAFRKVLADAGYTPAKA